MTEDNASAANQGNAKVGPYPYADRANLFGTLFMQYFGANVNDEDRHRAYKGMLAVAFPKAKRDKAFTDMYDEFTKDAEIDPLERDRLVMELVRVMDDLKTWDWANTPEDEAAQIMVIQ